MAPGAGRPSGAGVQALNPRGRIPGAARESCSWSGRSRRGAHVPPGCPEFAGGRDVRALMGCTAGGGFGSRGCSRWYPTFPRKPGRTPAPTPDSAVPQSCKDAECGRWVGAVDSASQPLPGRPCRSAAAGPPPPRYLLSEPDVVEGVGRGTRVQ